MADTASVTSNFLPVAEERDVQDLPVTGTLPAGLQGTLYRNGPNPQFSRPDAHWFHGDGMIHAFTLEAGRAAYSNRWVRTTRFLSEQQAGGPLAAVANDQGRANTNIVYHAGELMALEESHPPVAICPATLATLGPANHACGSTAPFTAHPKIDPQTGELLFFGYSSRGAFSTGIRCGSIGPAGNLIWQAEFDAPYASMIHDFAVTPNFVIVPVLPLAGDRTRAEGGGPAFIWDPALGARLALLRRGSAVGDAVWIDVPSRYAFHVINAWEGEGCIYLDVMQYEAPPLFPRAKDAPAAPEPARATPWRWTVPLDGQAARTIQLADVEGEFPRIDDRSLGCANRFSYLSSHRPDAPDHGLNALCRLDHSTGEGRFFAFEADDGVSEAVFVPRAQGAAEGVGWLLAIVWSARRGDSRLVVFDAETIEAGPVAWVGLPQRIPFGFHGNWVDRAALQAA